MAFNGGNSKRVKGENSNITEDGANSSSAATQQSRMDKMERNLELLLKIVKPNQVISDSESEDEKADNPHRNHEDDQPLDGAAKELAKNLIAQAEGATSDDELLKSLVHRLDDDTLLEEDLTPLIWPTL